MSDGRKPAHAVKALSGWGRYPVSECRIYRPEKRARVHELISSEIEPTWIARGLGRSYGDPAVNDAGGVLDYSRMNRMIAFDEGTGILTCEAGASLAEIGECFISRGWFLPVVPGTKFVTIGGAIANDVHGKNHHRDGSFSRWVREFQLLTPENGIVRCSPENNHDIFWATVGGVGLTGIILSATIQLQPVESSWIHVDYVRTKDAEETIHTMAATDANYQYSVAWVDSLARGKSLGRAVLICGNHARRGDLGKRMNESFEAGRETYFRVPFNFPEFAINPYTVSAFNTAYYSWHKTERDVLTHYKSFFYPLDCMEDWYRMYGKKGFVQYQANLPPDSTEGMLRLLERLSGSHRPSFLTVLKVMGEQGPGLLSFPFKGYTLALDLPLKPGLVEFLREIDRLVLDLGGRLYLAKDATTDAATFAAMYPRLREFKEIQRRVDPQGRMRSNLARRLGLIDERGTT